ncbi:multidrug/biocide efflux PACE transporter [Pseudomonas sp. 02C 26]|uniref:multidrug/biocide efflux PACE transporter n=1 Tax=Pseudomonas sp. 02C 26 TaxID=2054914 RepID=UPI0026C02B98
MSPGIIEASLISVGDGVMAENLIERSVRERVVHALTFEACAILSFTPIISVVTAKPLFDIGVLTLVISTVAIMWNMLYNYLFDRLQNHFRFRRGVGMRVVHAVMFEFGLIFFVVPMAAWWLSISLLEAFWLDIGILLMFLPYTMLFNYVYDKVRDRFFASANRSCQLEQ